MQAFNTRLQLMSSVCTLIAGILIGCSPTPKQVSVANQIKSTFIVSNISVPSTTTILSKEWNLPEARAYNFSVCVEDLARKRAIVNSSFEIKSGQDIQKVKSDPKGCLNWTENIAFDFFSEPTWVKVTRTIRASDQNTHKGELKVEMALNPWSGLLGNEEAFADLRREKVTPLSADEKGFSSRKIGTRVSLYVDSAQFLIEEDSSHSGTSIHYQLSFVPKLRLKDMKGNEILYVLNAGEFKVTPLFIHQQMDGKKMALNSPESSIVKINANQIIYAASARMLSTPKNGNLLFAILLTPALKHPAIDSFKGLYKGPNASRLISTHNVTLSQENLDADFSIAKVIEPTKSQSDSDPIKHSGKKNETPTNDKSKSSGFIASTIEGRIYGAFENETNVQRTIPIEMGTCLTSSQSSAPLVDEDFSVEVVSDINSTPSLTIDSTQFPRPSLEKGCIVFTGKVTHSIYHKEHFAEFKVRIVRNSTQQSVERRVYINPWSTGSNLLRDDTQYATAPKISEIDSNNPLARQSGLMFRAVFGSLIEVFYKLDDNLQLQLGRRYNIQLSPEVTRYDSSTEAKEPNKILRTGYYLLSVAQVRNGFEDKTRSGEYIHSWQKVVLNEAGNLTAEIEFTMRDLAQQGSRNMILFQLLPVKEEKLKFDMDKKLVTPLSDIEIVEDSGLKEKIFVSYLSPLESGVFERVSGEFNSETQKIAIKGRLKDWIQSEEEKLKAKPPELTLTPKEFAENLNLKLLSSGGAESLKDFDEVELTKFERAALFECSGESSVENCLKEKNLNIKTVNQKLCLLYVNQIEKANLIRMKGGKMMAHPLAFAVECRANPFSLVKVDSKIHAYKIDQHKFVKGISRSFNVGSDAILSESISQSTSRNKAIGSSFAVMDIIASGFTLATGGTAGVLLTAAKQLTPGLSGSISFSESKAKTRSISIAASSGSSLVIQEAAFEISLKESQKCLAIFVSEAASKIAHTDLVFDQLHGYYVCDKKSALPLVVNEKYYFVSQSLPAGYLLQNNDLRNRPWMLSVRGERDFNLFYSLVQNSLRVRNDRGELQNPVEIFGPSFDKIKDLLPAQRGILTPSHVGQSSSSKEDQEIFLEETTGFFAQP